MGDKMQEAMSGLAAAMDVAQNALNRIKKLDKNNWFDTVFADAYDQLQQIRLRNAIWYGINYDPDIKRLTGVQKKEETT